MKVSIITVVFNGVKTISDTIESVLNQTYKDIEYIIVDGSSNDGTQEIVKGYGDKIALFISEKDEGLYDAMNKGINLASGEIIGILNSDDWYAIDTVENVVNVFKTEAVDVVYGLMETVHSKGTSWRTKNGQLQDISYRMVIPHPTTFVKREIYDRVGLFNLKYQIAADYDLLLRIYMNDGKIKQIPSVLTYFRYGGMSTTKEEECAAETRNISLSYAGTDDLLLGKIEKYYQTKLKDIRIKKKINTIICGDIGYFRNKIFNLINKKKNEISIFGAGNKGFECAVFLETLGIEVEYFLDNDKSKYDRLFYGKLIKKTSINREEENFIIVAVMNYQEEISLQLEALGYQRNKDYTFYYDLIESL